MGTLIRSPSACGSADHVEGKADTPAIVRSHAPGQHPSSAIWDRAERPLLEDVDGDVLAILDACFASNLHTKGQLEHYRTYELFAAAGHDRQTAGPGPKSFTTALIASLKSLLEEYDDQPFTIRQLCETINLHPDRRCNQSHVWSRSKCYDRYIALAPLKRTPNERMQDYDNNDHHNRTRAVLSLRLSLTACPLTEGQIKFMAASISNSLKTPGTLVKRIDWVGLQSCERTIGFAAAGKAIKSALQLRKKFHACRDQHLLTKTRDETVQTPAKPYAPTSDDSHSRAGSPTTSTPITADPPSTQIIPNEPSHLSGARPKRGRAESHDSEDDQPHQKLIRQRHQANQN